MRKSLVLLSVCAVLFLVSNQYYGWNVSPKSSGELICDIIDAGLLLAAGHYFNKDE